MRYQSLAAEHKLPFFFVPGGSQELVHPAWLGENNNPRSVLVLTELPRLNRMQLLLVLTELPRSVLVQHCISSGSFSPLQTCNTDLVAESFLQHRSRCRFFLAIVFFICLVKRNYWFFDLVYTHLFGDGGSNTLHTGTGTFVWRKKNYSLRLKISTANLILNQCCKNILQYLLQNIDPS